MGSDYCDFRLGANVNNLATVAVSRLQGELAKDGRELPAASKKLREKSFPGKVTIDRSSEKAKGKSAIFSQVSSFDLFSA